MPFIPDEETINDNGGTSQMKRALEQRLIASGRQDLVDYFDFYTSRVRNFNPARPSIYWLHDQSGDPESEHLKENKYPFTAMVFVSNWQQQMFQSYYQLEGGNQVVIPNAIVPFDPAVSQKWMDLTIGTAANPLRLIYHTTPHRGLDLLLLGFDLAWKWGQARDFHLKLDVFSSFKIYGWNERDKPYERLFETCRQHPAIEYHGAVPNQQVREALIKTHVFAYPCQWLETSCLALIEAMSASCLCVHSNCGALPETAGGYSISYPWLPAADKHFEIFIRFFESVIRGIYVARSQGKRPLVEMPIFAAQRVAQLYNWNARTGDWIYFLESVKQQHEQKSAQ